MLEAPEERRNGHHINTPSLEGGRLYVMKFGGTSVGSVKAIERVTSIVRRSIVSGDSVIMVVSALSGMTDSLLRVCDGIKKRDQEAWELELEDIEARHNLIISGLHLPHPLRDDLYSFTESLHARLRSDATHARFLTPDLHARILQVGERQNVRIISATLQAQGIKAEPIDATFIETDKDYLNATPNLRRTASFAQEALVSRLVDGITPVVTGFIGATRSGKPTLLGRGGSDFTASIAAAVVNPSRRVDGVIFWKDVDGVFDSDPQINPKAKVKPIMTFREAQKLAQSGTQLFHPRAMDPLEGTNIPIFVKNTFNPDALGTSIVYE